MPEQPDQSGDKTEQPTPRRREEARREGQIARSTDLTAALSLLGGILLIRLFGPTMMDTFFELTHALGQPPALHARDCLVWFKQVGVATMWLMLPFLGTLMVVSVVATAVQSGIVITWKKLALKPDRINPVEGAKRLFSVESLTRLVLGLFKVTLLGAISYWTITGRIREIIAVGAMHPGAIYVQATEMIFELALKLGLVLLILGLIDYFVQRWKLEKQLRMTKQEVRDELKRMEGDPLIKQRRRQMQQRLAMQRIQAEVPRADVVVTNPTEYAVALRYDEAAMGAPRVVAKGRDFLAQRIRQIAQQHGVPVVERPPLARGLYAAVEVGQEVPPAFYRAVAEVLAYVYQLARRTA
jgi:flagellar biosynthetic protein FlhB